MKSVEFTTQFCRSETIPQPVRRRDEEAQSDEHGGCVATCQLEYERRHVRGFRPRPQLEEAADGRDVREHLHFKAVTEYARLERVEKWPHAHLRGLRPSDILLAGAFNAHFFYPLEFADLRRVSSRFGGSYFGNVTKLS